MIFATLIFYESSPSNVTNLILKCGFAVHSQVHITRECSKADPAGV